MGGTTAKAGIVRGGRPHVAHDFQVGGKGSFGGARAGTGIPVKVPVVDLAEVGAGGGSIAVVEGGGVLRVGPHSAGAVPGPACYGRGGEQPTVTDADLVLGYLDPTGLAGGVDVSLPLARAALDRVAQPLGLDTVQAARAIHDIVNANMVAAIRIVTVQRGIDPRQLTLVGFGGAGPMHVARLAAAFGIGTVVVPWGAGVASALGLVSADLGAERFRTLVRPVAALAPDELERAFADLERDARKEHDRAEGSDDDGGRVHTTRAARMRVRGQAHDLDVPLGPGTTSAAELTTRFAECYRAAYGVDPGADLQLTALRVPRGSHRREALAGASRPGKWCAAPLARRRCRRQPRRLVHRTRRLRADVGVRLDASRPGRPSRRTGRGRGHGHDRRGAPRHPRPRRRRAQPRPAPRGRLT